MSDGDPENSLSRVWLWWKVIWTIVRNLVYLLLLYFAFNRMQSPFEVVVLSMLVLIFQEANRSRTASIIMNVQESLTQRRILFTILEKLGEDTSQAEKVTNDIEKKYLRGNPRYYINLSVATLVYIGILFK